MSKEKNCPFKLGIFSKMESSFGRFKTATQNNL